MATINELILKLAGKRSQLGLLQADAQVLRNQIASLKIELKRAQDQWRQTKAKSKKPVTVKRKPTKGK